MRKELPETAVFRLCGLRSKIEAYLRTVYPPPALRPPFSVFMKDLADTGIDTHIASLPPKQQAEFRRLLSELDGE